MPSLKVRPKSSPSTACAIEFPDGFGLMRASNTTPILVLRFEADTQEAIERIQNQFKAVIESNPALKWPL